MALARCWRAVIGGDVGSAFLLNLASAARSPCAQGCLLLLLCPQLRGAPLAGRETRRINPLGSLIIMFRVSSNVFKVALSACSSALPQLHPEMTAGARVVHEEVDDCHTHEHPIRRHPGAVRRDGPQRDSSSAQFRARLLCVRVHESCA
jgi:hypothetical protein